MCIHIAVEVDGVHQLEVVGGLERAFLHRIELNPLHLDLKHGRQPAYGTKLLRHRVANIHLLDIKSAVDGCIDVTGSSCNIDLDVTPPFLLGPCAFFGKDVRLGLSVEKTVWKKKKKKKTLSASWPWYADRTDSLLDPVNLLTIFGYRDWLNCTLTLEKHVVYDLRHILLRSDLHLI